MAACVPSEDAEEAAESERKYHMYKRAWILFGAPHWPHAAVGSALHARRRHRFDYLNDCGPHPVKGPPGTKPASRTAGQPHNCLSR
jgi:hypothetical protein